LNNKTAVLLLNMGGPLSLDDVEPFLYNLFMDPDIIEIPLGKLFRPFIAKKISKKRSEKVRTYYKKIGGKSPLLELTRNQADALEKALSSKGEFRSFIAMRYWHPFTEEAVKEILAYDPQKLVLLPLYPHYSGTTSGSSFNEFDRKWKKLGKSQIEIIKINDWFNHEGYIDSWVHLIEGSLSQMNGAAKENVHLIFSAHGIPQKLVERGDPYEKQTEASVSLILDKLRWQGDWTLSYQSRVGPVKWLLPATDELLVELGKKGTKSVLMVPISFVSDHSETLYEMDIQYLELAKDSGIEHFQRVVTPNCHPLFIEALKDMVMKRLSP